MLRQTRRTLEHWTPDLGPYEQWLTERAADGWAPEYPGTARGDCQRPAGVGGRLDRRRVVHARSGVPETAADVTAAQPLEYLTITDVAAELNVSVTQVRTLSRLAASRRHAIDGVTG
jgi:hypothetical protein